MTNENSTKLTKPSLDGKNAIITGGAKGIGRAIVFDLANAGAKIFLTYRGSSDLAIKLQKELIKLGSECQILKVDVLNPKDIEDMIKTCQEKLGNIDILVNNAGMTSDNLVMRMSEDSWDDVINTNLKGTFLVSKAALRPMIRNRSGRIINITSVVGRSGNPGQANYSASKAGIIGFTRSLALEVAARGITVNAIAPGFVLTDMTKNLSDEQKEFIKNRIPMGRYADASEIAPLVTFLASEHAAYITGQTINVDGGLIMS
ncbi:MAG: 3-oxoacyl-[acyl-carrier-protein] reductase [Chloroflexi bacterium]|nr:3-oxoacyl-[acyl-carrier-protein] reductase [Chloroflexota bacterium]